ncbi:MAG: SDR family NAD(P)-dependent oxidoreductase [bacterium]|nr:SDR family oxidoreductase [Acidimicrobiia bacterium]MCY4648983.1 SDR family NAD(P)-dependent oxidoreductase [bacterium]
MSGKLAGRNAIVTGAASGIGKATAMRLAAEGATVFCVDRDEEGLAKVVADLGEGHLGYPADLSLASSCLQVVAAALDHWDNRIHILVNAAAILIREPTLEHSRRAWDLTFDVNLKAPFLLSRDVVASMIESGIGGAIVNVASVEAVLPGRGHVAYTASKGAITMLTRSAAFETAPYGIRVNAVSPGVIATAMNADLRKDPESWSEMLAGTPMGRHGEPEEIAAVIAFLASDDPSFVTGAIVTADGGWTLH